MNGESSRTTGGTTAFVRTFARVYGALWIIADCVNIWKVLAAIVSIQDPIERLGYVLAGLIATVIIFYSAFQILALKPTIRRHIRILLLVSVVPVLAKGIIPLDVIAWVFLALLPSQLLLHLLKAPKPTNPPPTV